MHSQHSFLSYLSQLLLAWTKTQGPSCPPLSGSLHSFSFLPLSPNESITDLVNKTTYPNLGKYLQRSSRTFLLYKQLTVACPKLSSVALARYCSLLPDYSFRHSELSARGCVRNQLSICWTVRKEKRRRREEKKGTRLMPSFFFSQSHLGTYII